MSMDFIRRTYEVPAKRGARVRFCDRIGGDRDGQIVGSRGQYLRVRLDGETRVRTMHPTWRMQYLQPANAAHQRNPTARKAHTED